MAEFRGGAGGFGGTSTFNTEQRQGKYFPHKNVVIFKNHLTDEVFVRCLTCKQKWTHPRLYPEAPEKCEYNECEAND